MKRFGTIYPFIETDEQAYKLGRHVANYEFFTSLLIHGTFDEFHVFCMNAHHFKLTKEKLLSEAIPDEQKDKVRLFLYDHLIENLRSTEYHVFHLGGWGYFFPGLVYLRNNHAKNKFPITGLIHSLNGIETNYHALKMCVAPLLPYDTIICSSVAGQMVLEKLFKQVSGSFIISNFFPSYKGNTAVIPLGVNDFCLNLPEKKKCRQFFKIPDDTVVLLSVGRFDPQTKADLYPLIDAAKRMTNSLGQKILLILAGGGPEKQVRLVNSIILEYGLADSVRVISNFTTEMKSALYAAADIFLSLSDNLQETFGIALIEAMAAGLPVIASDINGYKELIDNEQTGFKIPTWWTDQFQCAELAEIMNFDTMQLMLAQCMVVDTEELHTRLQSLIENAHLRQSIGSHARAVVQERYRWSHIIKQYETLWDSLFGQSREYKGLVQQSENPFCNNYLSLFSHYPTTRIQPDTLCSITGSGSKALLNRTIPAPYTDVGSLLNQETMFTILENLTSKPLRVSDIFSLKSSALTKPEKQFILLWMAKYSLIRLTQSVSGASDGR